MTEETTTTIAEKLRAIREAAYQERDAHLTSLRDLCAEVGLVERADLEGILKARKRAPKDTKKKGGKGAKTETAKAT